MNNYYCECCNYDAKVKSSFDKHLRTKKHIKRFQDVSKMYPNVSTMYPNVSKMYPNVSKMFPETQENPSKVFQCKYCNKIFKYSQGLSKHIKYTCKENKDEDLKELVRLLNEQNNIKDKELKEMKETTEKQLELMNKQIDKLTNKLQIQQINNSNTNTNSHNNIVNYNVQLLNYDKTDYSHLTEKDYFKCIIDCNHCVKTLIEKVHFNDEKPENKNIYISNIKNKFVMLYKNNKWQLVNRKDQIDDLYEYNEYVLENWYEEYNKKYPEIVKSFERYLNNKDNDNDLIRKVKDDILLMLYNNRMINNDKVVEIE